MEKARRAGRFTIVAEPNGAEQVICATGLKRGFHHDGHERQSAEQRHAESHERSDAQRHDRKIQEHRKKQAHQPGRRVVALAVFPRQVRNFQPIAVEKALYWNSGTEVFAGGTNVTATRLPPP